MKTFVTLAVFLFNSTGFATYPVLDQHGRPLAGVVNPCSKGETAKKAGWFAGGCPSMSGMSLPKVDMPKVDGDDACVALVVVAVLAVCAAAGYCGYKVYKAHKKKYLMALLREIDRDKQGRRFRSFMKKVNKDEGDNPYDPTRVRDLIREARAKEQLYVHEYGESEAFVVWKISELVRLITSGELETRVKSLQEYPDTGYSANASVDASNAGRYKATAI